MQTPTLSLAELLTNTPAADKRVVRAAYYLGAAEAIRTERQLEADEALMQRWFYPGLLRRQAD